jgi:hypothetical protein
MKKRSVLIGCCWVLMSALASGAEDQVVLAVPARSDLINLGFDFVGMFPQSMNLVCYDGVGEDMTLEHFDTAAGRWAKLSQRGWSSAAADRLVLVGTGAAVEQLKAGASWATQAAVVDGRRLHEVANAVNGYLRLSPAQWNRLAETYGFKLTERNREARRQGRYGNPAGRGARQREQLPDDASAPEEPASGAPVIDANPEEFTGEGEASGALPVEGRAVPRLQQAEPAEAPQARRRVDFTDTPRAGVTPAEPEIIRPDDK